MEGVCVFFCQLSAYNWTDYVNSLHRNGCYIRLKPMCFHNKVILLPMHITGFFIYIFLHFKKWLVMMSQHNLLNVYISVV